MRVAVVSGGPSVVRTWPGQRKSQYNIIIAVNAVAVSEFIGPYDYMVARDSTYLVQPRYYTPQTVITESKFITDDLKHRFGRHCSFIDAAFVAPPDLPKRSGWMYSSTLALAFAVQAYCYDEKPTHFDLFGFDLVPGYGLSEISQPFDHHREEWERPEFDLLIQELEDMPMATYERHVYDMEKVMHG